MNSRLLDILLKNNVIDDKQSAQAKITASKNRRRVENVLVELGFATDKDIAKAKSEEFNIPYIDLSQVNIPNEALTLIDSDLLKTQRAIPFESNKKDVKVAMVDPFDIPAIQALQHAIGQKKKLQVYITTESSVVGMLDKRLGEVISTEVNLALEDVEQPVAEITGDVDDIESAANVLQNAPVARIVNSILVYGAKTGSSDVHIEPLEKGVRVRYRIHGVMTEKLKLPKSVLSAVVARIKIMSKLKIDEKRLPQDGRLQIVVAKQKFDLRVSTLPTIYGEKVVMRLLERKDAPSPLEESGLRGPAYKVYMDGIKTTDGIILITGPTGSGKTRTLAGTLGKLNKAGVNIVTLEDPVEIRVAGVNQVQVNPDAGLTFASGLRSILRQDPDIIMVGEIRDAETASLAVQAALTGHLVLATLHTNSAAAALPRLIDMNVETYLLASVLRIVVAQRLARRICPSCKEAYVPSQEIVNNINKTLGTIEHFDVVQFLLSKCGKSKSAESADKHQGNGKTEKLSMKCPIDKGNGQHDIYLYRGKGCEECEFTGYKGRIGIFEVLQVTEKMGRMVMENKSSDDLENEAVSNGMITMVQDGYLKALEGLTTIEEVLRVNKELE